jgi:UDP-N-acetylglucosamine acyltransferase
MAIHPTAIISSKADVSADAEIGPYCIVGDNVAIGSRTRLIAHVVLEGKLTVGEDNVFYPYSNIGAAPQDLKYKGEPSETRIGSRNKIREFVTVNRGTEGGGMVTSIGDDNLLMAYVHIAHDVVLTNRIILANGVTFAGHVYVGEYANIGGHAGIHQFVRIGRHAMVGSYSVINQDVLPFSTIASPRESSVYGANRIGLERRGFTAEQIEPLQNALRILTRSGLNTSQALLRIEEELPKTREINELQTFIRDSKCGFIK